MVTIYKRRGLTASLWLTSICLCCRRLIGHNQFSRLCCWYELCWIFVQNDQLLFLHIQQQRVFLQLVLQRLCLAWKATPWLFFCLFAHLCGPSCFCGSLIQLHKRPFPCLLHHPFSLPHTYPPSRFTFLFSPGTWLICGLRVQRGDWGREDRSKLEGGRKHERKELGRARGREQAGEGRGGQERENAREWSNDLAAPAIIRGREGGV